MDLNKNANQNHNNNNGLNLSQNGLNLNATLPSMPNLNLQSYQNNPSVFQDSGILDSSFKIDLQKFDMIKIFNQKS